MTYRVYSGPRGSQSVSSGEKDRQLFKEFTLLDEAMMWGALHQQSRSCRLVD
jgi:hypothetical protein